MEVRVYKCNSRAAFSHPMKVSSFTASFNQWGGWSLAGAGCTVTKLGRGDVSTAESTIGLPQQHRRNTSLMLCCSGGPVHSSAVPSKHNSYPYLLCWSSSVSFTLYVFHTPHIHTRKVQSCEIIHLSIWLNAVKSSGQNDTLISSTGHSSFTIGG